MNLNIQTQKTKVFSIGNNANEAIAKQKIRIFFVGVVKNEKVFKVIVDIDLIAVFHLKGLNLFEKT